MLQLLAKEDVADELESWQEAVIDEVLPASGGGSPRPSFLSFLRNKISCRPNGVFFAQSVVKFKIKHFAVRGTRFKRWCIFPFLC